MRTISYDRTRPPPSPGGAGRDGCLRNRCSAAIAARVTAYRLSLLLAGAVCAAIIAFASVIAHGKALAGAGASAHLPVPLGLATLVLLLLTYGVGVGLGWLLWGRR
jgi:hypothetical protein